MDKRITKGEELTAERLIELAMQDAAYINYSLEGEGIDGARAQRAAAYASIAQALLLTEELAWKRNNLLTAPAKVRVK